MVLERPGQGKEIYDNYVSFT